jgi:hypothetical protein
MVKKYKWILIPLAAILAVILSALFLHLHKSNKGYTYSCFYSKGAPFARCLGTKGVEGACNGYYKLRGKSISDGIYPDSYTGATCEGLIGGDRYYFDANGMPLR